MQTDGIALPLSQNNTRRKRATLQSADSRAPIAGGEPVKLGQSRPRAYPSTCIDDPLRATTGRKQLARRFRRRANPVTLNATTAERLFAVEGSAAFMHIQQEIAKL